MALSGILPSASPALAGTSLVRRRWVQLLVGILAMVMVANLQYGWTLFVTPIDARHHWGKAAIQVAFTVFVLFETWLVPFEAYLVDRFGPGLLVGLGGVLVGLAWSVNSVASSLPVLYLGGALGGIGAGIVYGTAVGNALKWFPDRRGLAAGLTAAGFGAGSAATVIPISNMIASSGYESAFLTFGLLQGVVVVLVSTLLRAPRAGEGTVVRARVPQTVRDFTPLEMLRTPMFWLLYAMMVLIAMGGLMATAQIGPIAKDFKVADAPINLGFLVIAALPLALSIDRVLNGITRPFWGWISDRFGRQRTMTVAFASEAIMITLLILTASHPVLFVVFSGLTFFSWGEIYSLFPSLSSDLFGRQYATTNYGLLYTAKGTASLLVPVGSVLQAATGSWLPIFVVAIVFDLVSAVLAATVLTRTCRAHLAQAAGGPSSAGAAVPAMAGAAE
jgi:OFA family oxalate/formate antiporter-like MFS transporter